MDRIDWGNAEYGLLTGGTIVLTRRGPPMFGGTERTQEERDHEMATSSHERTEAPNEQVDLGSATATWMRKNSILVTRNIDPKADEGTVRNKKCFITRSPVSSRLILGIISEK